MFARIILLALCSNSTYLMAQATPGRIRQVTLYRDQALVTREIEVEAGEKDREIHIGRLPENVIPDSVYAEGTNEIDIRSVRIFRQASTDSNRAEVRELTEKISKLSQDRERTTRKLQLLNKKMEYIDQLMEFSSSSTQADIQRGLLNATALSELSNFSMGKQTELHDSQLELEFELVQINEQESLLKRELDLFTQTSTTQHEVSLQIASHGNQPGSIKLSYLVTGCGWEQQLVQVFDAELSGRFYHVATPLLSSFAYREADLINSLHTGLLQGSAMIYLDDRFVGRSQIPSIASGQHLVVGYGADQQVRTRRQVLEKSDEIQGGNRRMTFKYRLVVANFKSEPVQLRLFDRLPYTGQSSDVSVQLFPPKLPISTEGLYERIQKPRGILRWDLDVPANRFGEKAFDVDYSYSTEFDRNLMLTAFQSKDQLESDYIELSTPSSGMGGGMGGMGGGSMNAGGK